MCSARDGDNWTPSDQVARKGISETLWIVSTMRLFIHAEGTGDWWLHLHSTMLPHSHATGHLVYAKSIHLYVQQMKDHHHIMPEKEYRQFTQEGYFTIRHSEKFWDGIFSDQVLG